MTAPRGAYAERAIPAVSRLLTLLDRNPHSPTYGCFHRDYWLYKTSDFPDMVRQFGVHALALVYAHDFPGSPYRGNPMVRDWTAAALDFWARRQHGDGSFDEFYPFERGWVGPTAFTAFTSAESLMLMGDAIPVATRERVTAAVVRAARFVMAGESEEDHLANHHAMASLAVWKAFELTGDRAFEAGFRERFQAFLGYHEAGEGWSREYDGPDPGYLSATISFLGKIYQANRDPEIRRVLVESAEFCSYFLYPNGYYAGSLGSRNTQHFYPHGFEILAPELPTAAALAERALAALDAGGLVPPEIMSDRYVFYRVPELLQAYLDYAPRPADLPPLPCERDDFTRYFPKARIFAAARGRHYMVANLGKGGVVKVFDRSAGRLVLADNGLIGRLDDGRLATSQWIDPAHRCEADGAGWSVSGTMHAVSSQKVFSLLKNLVFRSALLLLGWSPGFCHFLKGRIRQALILGTRPVPVHFHRTFRMEAHGLALDDTVEPEGSVRFRSLTIGGDAFVRYVPQSRFFQASELATAAIECDASGLSRLNAERRFVLKREIEGGAQDRKTR